MPQSNVSSLFPFLIRLKACSRIIFRGVENRGRLAIHELDEAWLRLLQSAVLLATGIAATSIAGVGINILVAAIFWDTAHRVTALALMATLQLAAVVCLAWQIYRRCRNWTLLEETRTQLAQDRKLLGLLSAKEEDNDTRTT